jgi:hypothetical protein
MVKASTNGKTAAGRRSGAAVHQPLKFKSQERDFNVKASVVIPVFGVPEKEIDKVLAILARLVYLNFGEDAQVTVDGRVVEAAL